MKFHLVLVTITLISQILMIYFTMQIYGFEKTVHAYGYSYITVDYAKEVILYVLFTLLSIIGSFSMTFSMIFCILLTLLGCITQSISFFFITHYIILITPVLKGIWPVMMG